MARPSAFAKSVELYARHPDTPWIFSAWMETVMSTVSAAGYRFLVQPDETIAGPCLTKRHYAEGALKADGSTMPNIDHRHMNKDFGLAVLSAFAKTVLKVEPQTVSA